MVFRLYHNNRDYYSRVKEEEVVKQARDDDPFALEYLFHKYKNFIKYKSKSYFIMGAENEDLIQEGMIGLYKAIMAYDKSRTISFRNFAYICITRQIITAIKAATRQKHLPLNSYVSLYKQVREDDNERILVETISGGERLDPMNIYINRERLEDIGSKINESLSKLELMIFIPYVHGKSYKEIALETKKTEKCIDNALQRIRRKLGDSFSIEE